ncbi:hypothetical protein M2349_000332 [Caldanaerobacter subterraneus subsp. tengcongensis MB4]|uniref:Uncharacterized protein n=1 Tax=Caldanaerobacter subterraneus subsp. tengcongensis (strain DSM 15242 / JCM 11007 / NBRC 100824 / MB4) TaxID=273068 RepID=Q8R8G5_CALS4|nr:hypothetical protein [Caldanaerobacter subterraneus]AAM25211.1 hypothetical protein TTE2034 [Caldanaerobacter subterraneus subsp. tengcongensis MB4]MCS3915191.1 hypothetical protein [Caldanaerobacter subterraneus subsp. tengcongensis MB4]
MSLKEIESKLRRAYSLPIEEQRKYHEQIWNLEKEKFYSLVPDWDDEAVMQYLQNFRDKLTRIFKGEKVGLLWAVENAPELDKKYQDCMIDIDEAIKIRSRGALFMALKNYEAVLKDIYLAYKESQKVKEG